MTEPLRIGLSSCFFHPDPERPIFKGKRLVYMEESMFFWVQRCGALAYLLPSTADVGDSLKAHVAGLDGVLLSGGVDMAPESYGETPIREEWAGDRWRDDYELALAKHAFGLGKPILGICRGFQVLNVALGGTLYQDINTQKEGTLVHRDWEIYDQNFHDIDILQGSKLQSLYGGASRAKVNSVHHQGVKDVAKGLTVEARSTEDGIIEAIRWDADGTKGQYAVGIQWHPEFQDVSDTSLLSPEPIMNDFLAACRAMQ